jgi:Delta24-sterol reductase
MNFHNQKISILQKQLIDNPFKKVSLLRTHSCCLKSDYKKKTIKLNISNLNNILKMDTVNKFIIVEPRITMEQVLMECLKHDVTIPVLTEFKHMSLGGAICGISGESRSFSKGLIHESVIEYEIILGNGEKIIVNSQNEHKELFYNIPGSFGSFGIITFIKLKLEKSSKYIKVNYTIKKSLSDAQLILKEELNNPSCDYLECIGEKNKYIVIKGFKQESLSWINWILYLFNIYFFKYIWFYNHIQNITDNYTEYFKYYDYTFRWDRGAFWHASKRLKYSLFNRILYSNQLECKKLYQRARRRTHLEREMKKINHDMIIPLDKLENFFNLNVNKHNVFPIWLLPIINNNIQYPFSLKEKGFYVNLGVYGYIQQNNNNFIDINRNLEKYLMDNNGLKRTWNECYYTKDEFWKMFDQDKYNKLRDKYKASKFIDLYTKTCSFYNKLIKVPELLKYKEKCIILRNSIINNKNSILKFNRRKISYTMSDKLVNNNMIDMTSFNNILHLDLIKQEILVEPGVTMEQLFKETSKYNMVPLILPEFKFLTVGGLIQGTGLESSSFKYGQFNDICSELHFIVEEIDDIIIAKKNNKYSDLYYGVSGSLGGLSVMTAAKIKLRTISEFITVTYYKYNNLEEGLIKLESFYKKNIDFLEAIVYNKEKIVIITGKSCNLNPNLNLTSLYNWNSEWYYEHVNNVTSNKIYYQDQFSKNDYLFRYDNGAFWMGKYAKFKGIHVGGYNIFRKLFSGYFTTDYLYKKLKSKPIEERENRFIIQDLYVPHDNCLNFLNQIHDYVEIYPIWLCPIKATKEKQYMSPHYSDKHEYMIDVGLWGIPKFGYPFNGIEVNRKIEELLTKNDGKKMNYGKFYYTKEELNKLYDMNEFELLRNKYKSNRLKNRFR